MSNIKFACIVPIRTLSNIQEHWANRAKRHAKQRQLVMLAWIKAPKHLLPCVVRLTRHGKRTMDGDNLQTSLKAIRDAIADCLIPGLKRGMADGDERITWEYDQFVCVKYYVQVEIRSRDE